MTVSDRDIGQLEGRILALEQRAARYEESSIRLDSKIDNLILLIDTLRLDRARIKGGYALLGVLITIAAVIGSVLTVITRLLGRF